MEVTSQTWKDSTWKHRVVIYQPTTLLYPDTAAMFLTTEYSTSDDAIGRFAADAIGAQLDKPKLVINATGDDYSSLRAFDQCANGLPGATNLLMVANAAREIANSFDQVFGVAMSWFSLWANWVKGELTLPMSSRVVIDKK